MNTQEARSREPFLDALVRSALALGTPAQVAEEARRVTAQRFRCAESQAKAELRRAEAYFWGVVRRRALRGRAPAIARLIVAASLASELAEAGHAPEAIGRALI
jgi:hypothetical protein